MSVHDRLKELGIELQPPPPPVANYIRSKRSGNLLFVAGQRPVADANGNRPTGQCGAELTVEEAYQVARQLGIRLLGNHEAVARARSISFGLYRYARKTLFARPRAAQK